NARLVNRWASVRPLHYVLWAALVISAVFTSLRTRAEEAALLLGGLVFFLLELPANYYYIYFPLVFTVLLTSTNTALREWLLAAYGLLWASLWYYHGHYEDELIANYYKCWAFFLFFAFWVFGRAAETWLAQMRARQLAASKSLEIG
ncbi:MAG: hypothetical protein K2Q01_05095, partial [Rickettsiales bacterium]|nr:hypothetical protein [Rickettsiales bacterium]